MKQLLRSSRLTAACLMMAMLMGCAHSVSAPDQATVQIPRDCEDLAAQVPLPDIRKGESTKAALAEHRAALVNADNNIDATRTCQAHQRERFAKGL